MEVTQGMLLLEGFYWDQDDEARQWNKRFKDKTGKMPNMLNAATYSAVTNYLNAAQELGTDDADAVLAYLHEQEINDLFAKNGRIRRDGQMIHDVYLYEVKSPAESDGEGYFYITEPGRRDPDRMVPRKYGRV
ncbi:ABC transporter substrate-binding protein [Alloalcanivorax venustensis]|uniref:ABC transporter substrate-binding protein n=1 Tax=Alloalcanivorax venustensis TaxID=172371 RepID=UPI003AB91C96